MKARGAGGGAAAGMPLRGRCIAVTRPAVPGDEFVAGLERLGAEVLVTPLIRIDDPPDPVALREAVRAAESYDWIVFTSANAVDRFVAARLESGLSPWPAGATRVCAVGPATGAAIERVGGRVDGTPAEYVGEGVATAITASGPVQGKKVLFPRAAGARPVVATSLRRAGADVDDVVAYRTVSEAAGVAELRGRLGLGEVDVVTFTSSSAVRSFAAQVGADVGRALVACIGPITAATAREAGLAVAIEAGEYTTGGLVAAIVNHLAGTPSEESEISEDR